jgi:glucose-6-phosphate-specific signal transduction histidine kinase
VTDAPAALWIALQIASFGEAKDWLVLALVGLVGTLLGAAWGDIRGQIRAINGRLDAKIEEDKTGYERLTRCEERLDALRGGRRKEE